MDAAKIREVTDEVTGSTYTIAEDDNGLCYLIKYNNQTNFYRVLHAAPVIIMAEGSAEKAEFHKLTHDDTAERIEAFCNMFSSAMTERQLKWCFRMLELKSPVIDDALDLLSIHGTVANS